MTTLSEDVKEIKRAFQRLCSVIWLALEPTPIGSWYRASIRLLDRFEAWLKARDEERERE